MPTVDRFAGFPPGTLDFFADLAAHNSKAWFDRNRPRYDEFVLGPARAFVMDLGERLLEIAPGLRADPRTNQSLFRINRDTRFSKDKSPYKTHLALWLWEGGRPRMENSGFYFHLEPGLLMLGAGLYQFPKPVLEEYRRSVDHKKYGPALIRATNQVAKTRGLVIWGETYKRVPRGFEPDHPRAAWLKHSGLACGLELAPPKAVHSRKLLDFCLTRYKKMVPLHRWVRDMAERSGPSA